MTGLGIGIMMTFIYLLKFPLIMPEVPEPTFTYTEPPDTISAPFLP